MESFRGSRRAMICGLGMRVRWFRRRGRRSISSGGVLGNGVLNVLYEIYDEDGFGVSSSSNENVSKIVEIFSHGFECRNGKKIKGRGQFVTNSGDQS
jgi:hypothetical protein